jgi:hypothetical protein
MSSSFKVLIFPIVLVSLITWTGCGTDGPATTNTGDWLVLEKSAGIPIAGQWTDDWGTAHQIASGLWVQSSEFGRSQFIIDTFDSDAGFAVAFNDEDNQWSPGKWSRFDWTWQDDVLYFCNVTFEAETSVAAEAVPAADPTDPATSGCGGFAWTVLHPMTPVAIAGTWSDQWGSNHSINNVAWTMGAGESSSRFTFVTVENDSGFAIAQNDLENEFSAGKWSRFDWTWSGANLYFCQTAFDAETREAAEAVPAADPTDPVNSGCGGFGWTILNTVALPADNVVDAPGDTSEGFADATEATATIRGSGTNSGSSDVFSLGYKVDEDNYITMGWTGAIVTNGPGTDFVVFENAFEYDDGLHFMDHMVVLLSRDGLTWVPWPFDYIADDETTYSADPAMWKGFAGINPVLYNEDTNKVDPFDAVLAGGDHFDLDNLPDTDPDALAIKEFGFSYIRIVAAPTVINSDTGEPFVQDQISNGGDIDGVVARYVVAL